MTAPTFADGEIDIFLRRRVCARCYGELSKRPAEDRTWEAFCHRCESAWHYATISRRTAEERGQRAVAELYEVKMYLNDLFPQRKETAEKIMSELGF